MKRIVTLVVLLVCGLMMLSSQAMAQGKGGVPVPQEVYTGTIINISGRSYQTGFTLRIDAKTSDEEAMRYLGVLADNGQEALLNGIRKNNLGYIAATGQTRRDLLVVREAQIEGKGRRVIVAFERWLKFGELRAGTRSLDYPWSVMEIYFDAKGRGTGTFIGLCQVKLVRDKKTGQVRLELENFGSFPEKVMGVMRRKK